MRYPLARLLACACLLTPYGHLATAQDLAITSATEEESAETLTTFYNDQEQDRPEDVPSDKYSSYLLGDMWGLREELDARGMALNVSFAMNIAGNPVGGRDQGVTQLNSTGIDFGIDFEEWLGWDGLTFFSSMSIRSGTSLSLKYLGNVVNVQQLYGNESYRLVNLYFQQAMFNDYLGLKVGRIAQFDDFSRASAFGYYMNNAFDGQPVGFFFMGPFTAYPVTTWGALARSGYLTGDQEGIYAMVGAYGADPTLQDVDNHGTNFSFDFDFGANIMGEIGYKHDWVQNTTGNPGKIAVGGWWFTGPFPKFNGGPANGAGGFFYFIHQNLYNEASGEAPSRERLTRRDLWGNSDNVLDSVQGLFFFSTGQFASNLEVSQADWFVSNGFYYRGLIPGRDQDVLSIGCAYLSFGDNWAQSQIRRGQLPQDYEMELELSYRFVVTDYFYVQPNIQGVINPQANGSLPDALVLGLQMQVDF